MLQAKDLMIGDWVMNTHNRKPEQVCEIMERMAMLDYNDLYDYDEIEPIPLTAEILEKNGFVEWEDKCYRWEYADGIYINADFTEEEPWAHISNRCYHATPVCRYVHEFQHALRLCGIEKEIVI